MRHFDYLIIGAGPTGLGAAYQLKKNGVSSFLVLEAGEKVGGLSASYRDAARFSWDVGGHVLFSSNDAFIRLLDELMGEDLLCHSRRARVRVAGGWTDYPFQDHIHQLDDNLAQQCRKGLDNATGPGKHTRTFADWIRHSFGSGIAELFMEPYNRKVWACPLHRMGFGWVHDRVSSAWEQSASGKGGWGPNSFFRYPAKGGIGAIFHRLSRSFDNHILFRHEVIAIDLERKTVTTADGEVFDYKTLLNTAPLNHLVKNIIRVVRRDVRDAADRLVHNSVTVVGIGVDAPGDCETSWMYFPDPDCPFYRLTHLHNYAPDITPSRGQSALMVEISTAASQRPESERIVGQVVSSLIASSQLREKDKHEICSTWEYFAPHAYPIPTLGRDNALSMIHPFLEHYHVYSRGRFGAWKYEVGNMDHSVMQGIEWANRMVRGTRENVYGG